MNDKMSKFKTGIDNVEDLENQLLLNREISNQYYDESKLLKLSQDIAKILNNHILANSANLINWKNIDIETRKSFITDTLNLLLENFPSAEKPKIYFLPKIANLSAAFFNKDFSPKYRDMAVRVLGSDKSAFVFTGDLSDHGIIGQIVHEFTHYLQSIGKSTVPLDILKSASAIYHMPSDIKDTASATMVYEIYKESIIEKEAQYTGEFVKKYVSQIVHSRLSGQNKSPADL
jgi:hypothetical protein